MQSMASELNMYESQVSEHKMDIERLQKELQEVKKKYYMQKKKELVQKYGDSVCESACDMCACARLLHRHVIFTLRIAGRRIGPLHRAWLHQYKPRLTCPNLLEVDLTSSHLKRWLHRVKCVLIYDPLLQYGHQLRHRYYGCGCMRGAGWEGFLSYSSCTH